MFSLVMTTAFWIPFQHGHHHLFTFSQRDSGWNPKSHFWVYQTIVQFSTGLMSICFLARLFFCDIHSFVKSSINCIKRGPLWEWRKYLNWIWFIALTLSVSWVSSTLKHKSFHDTSFSKWRPDSCSLFRSARVEMSLLLGSIDVGLTFWIWQS